MIFFDLDGTLWDATESTAQAWTGVFAQWNFGMTVTPAQIRSVAGKPYLECLEIVSPDAAACDNLPKLLQELGQAEREAMQRMGGRYYEGALQGLSQLAQLSKLYLVSNCNDWYLEAFLDHSGTRHLFADTVCHGTTGLPKHENLRKLMAGNGLTGGYYVGDTNGDRIAAEAAGLVYVHAEYGFGGEGVPSDIRCGDFASVVSWLRGKLPR
jgi:phosphoglycolate phosphatase